MNTEPEIKTVEETRAFVARQIEECLCEAEKHGLASATWAFLGEMADFAGIDLDAIAEKYDF